MSIPSLCRYCRRGGVDQELLFLQENIGEDGFRWSYTCPVHGVVSFGFAPEPGKWMAVPDGWRARSPAGGP